MFGTGIIGMPPDSVRPDPNCREWSVRQWTSHPWPRKPRCSAPAMCRSRARCPGHPEPGCFRPSEVAIHEQRRHLNRHQHLLERRLRTARPEACGLITRRPFMSLSAAPSSALRAGTGAHRRQLDAGERHAAFERGVVIVQEPDVIGVVLHWLPPPTARCRRADGKPGRCRHSRTRSRWAGSASASGPLISVSSE